MPEFMLELYAPRGDLAAVRATAARAHAAADELTRAGTPVRYVRSIFVPDDETCFLLFEADASGAIHEAAARARLSFERLAEAVAT
jgi:hypothetical protein